MRAKEKLTFRTKIGVSVRENVLQFMNHLAGVVKLDLFRCITPFVLLKMFIVTCRKDNKAFKKLSSM